LQWAIENVRVLDQIERNRAKHEAQNGNVLSLSIGQLEKLTNDQPDSRRLAASKAITTSAIRIFSVVRV